MEKRKKTLANSCSFANINAVLERRFHTSLSATDSASAAAGMYRRHIPE